MFVHLIHMHTFTATVSGRKLKDVFCEKCQTPFHYHLDRNGIGKSSSPYGMFPANARARADKAARANLAKRLMFDQELVPCPKCQWINISAIRHFRKSRYKQWGYLALLIAFLALILEMFLYFDAQDIAGHQPDLNAKEIWITAAIALLLITASLLTRYLLRNSIDPNRLTPAGLPDIPPGTPPALLQAGDGTYAPRPDKIPTIPTDATWAIFRAGQLQWEPLCCVCLDDSTHTYNPLLAVKAVLPAPLCHRCFRHLRLHFWLRNLALLPFAFFIGWTLTLFLPAGLDPTATFTMTFAFGTFLTIFGFWIIDRTLQPYRLKTVDPARSIHQISFKNPAYTAILIRRLAESDGIA